MDQNKQFTVIFFLVDSIVVVVYFIELSLPNIAFFYIKNDSFSIFHIYREHRNSIQEMHLPAKINVQLLIYAGKYTLYEFT